MSLSRARCRRSLLSLVTACLVAACGGSSNGGFNPPPPPSPPPAGNPEIGTEQVFVGVSLVQPVAMLQAPGDSSRWFVVERAGVVQVFDNDPMASNGPPFIDISVLVESGPGEAGLLGMAFHPDWGVNDNYQVFLSYTRSGGALESYVSRFHSMDGGLTLDASTEEAVMTLLQPNNNHNGGNIAFGPDGYLYAGWGDGGGEGDPLDNAQNTSNLFGTFTRIDVDGGAPYAIPADNPFAANAACVQGNGADACPEIFAWGLRNPWRWSFDATTGELWAGDVGQGAVEEVDIITLGGNYGWRCREGTRLFDDSGVCPGGFVEPITEYGRSSGQSITGGYVYRGNAIPDLQGWYVFGDFVSGRIFAVPADSPPATAFTSLLTTALSISSFAVDSAGELYVVDFGGDLFRIVAAP